MTGKIMRGHGGLLLSIMLMMAVSTEHAMAADVQAFRFGKDLASDCVGRDVDFCTGYIAGVVDLMTSLYAVTGNPKFHACPPPGTTPSDLVKVVVAFLDKQKSYDADASGNVFFAVRDMFPCPGA